MRTTAAKKPTTDEGWRDVAEALKASDGTIEPAAKALGVDARTLRRWLKDRSALQTLAGALREAKGIPGPRGGRGA